MSCAFRSRFSIALLVCVAGCGRIGFGEGPGAGPGDDAGIGVGIDAPGISPDAPPSGNGLCYGPSGWQVCLSAAASGSVQLSGTLDTDKSTLCLAKQPASWTATQPDACIIAGDTVTVSNTAATGSRPLVLVAQTRIIVSTLLDISSHHATGIVGAGAASSGDCKPFGGNPGIGSAGAGGGGGSFMFPGGNGGTGDAVNQPGGQAAGGNVGAPTRLRGGCTGQPGGGGKQSDGGAGGGAVYLVSAGMISIAGDIDVSGAGGAGVDSLHGGGGGGSGGMIFLYGSAIATSSSSILIANGGGGGGGSAQSGPMMKGSDGHEPALATPIAPAPGGTGGIQLSFDGGDGGSGFPALSTTVPGLLGRAGDTAAGGGGGGGGGGYIRSNLDLGAAAVSPAADIRP